LLSSLVFRYSVEMLRSIVISSRLSLTYAGREREVHERPAD
jgi:hypothetical protein